MPERIIAIGDIHGCSIALASLVESIAPCADDTLAMLGDSVDWGWIPKGCWTQVIFFTHHQHLVDIAEEHLSGDSLFVHRLNCVTGKSMDEAELETCDAAT